MIVDRAIWKVKHECRGEFIELIKAALEEAGVAHRVSSYIFGPYDTVVVDVDFETEEEQRKHKWDMSKPKASEFAKKHDDLIESGLVNELLRVH